MDVDSRRWHDRFLTHGVRRTGAGGTGLLLVEYMSPGLLIGLVIGALLALRSNRRYFERR
jgi:hypothetical protein